MLNWEKKADVVSKGRLQDLIDKLTALVNYLVLLCRSGRVLGLGLDRHQNHMSVLIYGEDRGARASLESRPP